MSCTIGTAGTPIFTPAALITGAEIISPVAQLFEAQAAHCGWIPFELSQLVSFSCCDEFRPKWTLSFLLYVSGQATKQQALAAATVVFRPIMRHARRDDGLNPPCFRYPAQT